MKAALNGGARIILTSRDYIYAAARSNLKASSFPHLEEAKVVIKVAEFTKTEREQILYNHLKLGSQPSSFLEKLEPKWLEAVAEEPHFLPEIARRLGDPVFTRHIHSVDRRNLMEFFKRPKEFLLELISNLDAGSQAALGLIHLRGGRLESPFTPASGDQNFGSIDTHVDEFLLSYGSLRSIGPQESITNARVASAE